MDFKEIYQRTSTLLREKITPTSLDCLIVVALLGATIATTTFVVKGTLLEDTLPAYQQCLENPVNEPMLYGSNRPCGEVKAKLNYVLP